MALLALILSLAAPGARGQGLAMHPGLPRALLQPLKYWNCSLAAAHNQETGHLRCLEPASMQGKDT